VLGDIIVSFDGTPIKRTEDLLGALDTKRVGDVVKIKVFRDGKEVEVAVKLGERRVGQGSE
jgi:serine protease Do